MIYKTIITTPDSPYAKLPLSNKTVALIDTEDLKRLAKFKWKLIKSRCVSYACRRTHVKGKNVTLRLHRIIANTPAGMECHHINHNPLDNRSCNLENLTPAEHRRIH